MKRCECCGDSRYIIKGECRGCGWVQGSALTSRHFITGAI